MSPIALTVLAAGVSGLVTALVILLVVRRVVDRRLAAAGDEIAARVRVDCSGTVFSVKKYYR